MKKIQIILLLLVLNLKAVGTPVDSINAKFRFAINVGDADWNMYKTAGDRKNALQIPLDIITKLDTKELLEVCLLYPYLPDILAFNNSTAGFKAIVDEFNGLKELTKRKDLPDVLIAEFYELLNASSYLSNHEISNKATFPVRVYVISHMFGMNEVLEKINREKKVALCSAINEKRNYILNNKEIFGYIGTFAIDNLYQILQNSTPIMLLNRDYQYSTRYTPNGSPVTVLIIPDDMTMFEKEYYRNYVINNYGVEVLSEATPSYNCHAYAWHMTEENIDDEVWINDEDIYWEDSSYIEVPESVATKVSYQNNHSAIRVSSTDFISKWGSYPLVRHSPTNVPGYGNPIKYYVRFSPLLVGETAFNESTNFYVTNLHSIFSVTWSINNSAFTLSTSGNNCSVSYNQGQQYDSALLTASILLNGIIIKTIEKPIIHIGEIEGNTVLCTSGIYNTISFPDSLSVTWSIDNTAFSLNTSGTQCIVSCNNYSQSREACLTASISNNLGIVAILTKNIYTHGIGLNISGTQEEYISTNGYYPEQTISYNAANASSGYSSSNISVNANCDIILESDRFQGMEVSFVGEGAPINVTHNGSVITFHTQPYSIDFEPLLRLIIDDGGPIKPSSYPFTMQLRDNEGCSDFDLNFIVRSFPFLNDTELQISTTSTTLYVHLTTAGGTPIGGGLYQQDTWYLSVINAASGQTVTSKTVTGSDTSVNISSYSSGLYIVRAVHDGNVYSAKFIK